MALEAFSWENVGPSKEERVLAGRVAGYLWLTVLPMVVIGALIPDGLQEGSAVELALLTIPSALWGTICLRIAWDRVPTPLFFHIPAALALPYIALLVGVSGGAASPFDLTLLMLLGFCAYFFPPPAAIPYLVSCLVVLAFPYLYDDDVVQAQLAVQLWVAMLVYPSVAAVIMLGKQQLLALRNEAQELSLHDSLTGLANRRALAELLASRRAGGRMSDSLGLLMIDLDDFKETNTAYGLPGGDRVLCAVANALRGLSRQDDVVVRLGGDEFAIVVPQPDSSAMARLAERVIVRVREVCADLQMSGVRLTASAGWAIYPYDSSSLDQLLPVADRSLRAAKAAGKARALAPQPDLIELADELEGAV
jgi:diguanylate cyclase (GGDEF)-like protein